MQGFKIGKRYGGEAIRFFDVVFVTVSLDQPIDIDAAEGFFGDLPYHIFSLLAIFNVKRVDCARSILHNLVLLA